MYNPANTRMLRLESLEERTLLAVVAGGIEQMSELVVPTEATTWIVNTQDDPTSWNTADDILSLREAVDSAAVGDTIVFSSGLAGETITLNGSELEITKGITIDASSIGGITIDADQKSRVLFVSGGSLDNPAILIGLTISGGYYECEDYGDGGGGIYNSGTLELKSCFISGNTINGESGFGDGGGINSEYGTLTLTNSFVMNNSASYRGGGIYCDYDTSLTMTNSIISRNISQHGGGIYSNCSTSLTMTNCIISCNEAGGGGGVFLAGTNYWEFSCANCTITGNKAKSLGGGFYVTDSSYCSYIYNSIIAQNTAGFYGHDIYGYFYNVYNSISSYAFESSTNFSYDASRPLFTDFENGDYSLAEFSQATNRGDNSYLENISTDLVGNPRIVDGNVDIGALEYQIIGRRESRSTLVTTELDIVDETDGIISLREAIQYALPGETILFADNLKGRTFELNNGELLMDKTISIDATSICGAMINANGRSRIISVSGGSKGRSVLLVGLTITNGYSESDGGGLYNSGFLRLINTAIVGNISEECGGGIFNDGNLFMTNCTVTSNQSSEKNCGLYNSSGTVNLYNTIVAENSGDDIFSESGAINAYNSLSSFVDWTSSANCIVYDSTKPLFQYVTSPTDNYLYLADESQAIDKGNNNYISGWETDIIGNDRIINGNVDIGAHEYRQKETNSTVVTTILDVINPYDGKISLREAIDYANNDDNIITFDSSLSNQTITLDGGLYISRRTISIDATGMDGITIDANRHDLVFWINDAHVELIGLTITGGYNDLWGYGGGGICNQDSYLTLRDCSITGNYAANGIGGGIVNFGGEINLINCIVSNNCVGGSSGLQVGGGICNWSGNIMLTDCDILENSAPKGGGIYLASNYTSVYDTVVMTNCNISGNRARESAGVSSFLPLIMIDCTVSENISNGGDVSSIAGILSTQDLTLVNCSITQNISKGGQYYNSGGIYCSGKLEARNCTIARNAAERPRYASAGGVLSNDAVFYNCIVVHNTVAGVVSDIEELQNGYSNIIVNTLMTEQGPYLYDPTLPLFAGPDNGDFTLAENSQAIDKGNNDYVTTETDLAGNHRSYNGIVDLGAYEYQLGLPSINVSVDGWYGDYDGSSHSVSIDDPYAATDTILYSVDGKDYNLTTAPEYTDAGNYTTYIKISRNNYCDWYGNADVIITPALIDDVTLVECVGEFDGAAYSIKVSDSHADTDTILYSIDGKDYNLTKAPEYTGIGTYTTYVKISRKNYCDWYGKAFVIIVPKLECLVTTLIDVVDSEDGLISLREALRYAANGDTISFSPSLTRGMITLNGAQLEINTAVIIDASDIGGITITGDGRCRILDVSDVTGDIPVELVGLTITGGEAGYGGGIYNICSLSMTNCTVAENSSNSNTSSSSGGGIYNTGTLTMINCTVIGNSSYSRTSSSSGGGIYNSGTLTLKDCTIATNSSSSYISKSSGVPYSYSYGGGIYNNGTLTMTSSTVSQNRSYASSYSSIPISNGSVYSYSYGGGICNNGTLTMTNCIVAKNRAPAYGSNYAAASNYIHSYSYGGGIDNSGKLTLTNCTVAENTSNDSNFVSDYSYGGGISNGGTSYIYNTIISQNNACNSGNDVYRSGGSIYAYNTISSFIDWTESENCFNVYPNFTSGYALSKNSKAINKGNNAYVSGLETDIAGNSRVSHLIVDIGAYEYQQQESDYEIQSTVVTTNNDIVDPTDNLISLREAIIYATDGDIITFDSDLAGQTIKLDYVQLTVDKCVTIDASDVGEITIDANRKSRIFCINSGTADVPVELIGLTITGGWSNNSGGGVYNNGALAMTNCYVTRNTSSSTSANAYGGGIYNNSGSALTMTNCTVSENTSYATVNSSGSYGGGIYNNYGCTLMMTGCAVSENMSYTTASNSASFGGGIYNEDGSLFLTNCIMSENIAYYGGCVSNEMCGVLAMTNCTVSRNTAQIGGGIQNGNSATLTMTNCVVSGNNASYSGGGFYIGGGHIIGGHYASVTLTNCTVSSNIASSEGGGICNRFMHFDGTDCYIYLCNTIVALNMSDNTGNDVYNSGGSIYACNSLSTFIDWTKSEYCIVYDASKPLFCDEENGDFTLAENSQAIDKGNNSYVTTETDLFGNVRIYNGTVDLGANETFDVSIKGWFGPYDGLEHAAEISDLYASTDTILYSTDGKYYSLAVNPGYTEVGSYITYVKVSRDGYPDWIGRARVVITPPLIDDVTLVGWTGEIDGAEHSVTITDNHAETDTILYSTDGKTYNLTAAPSYTEVGTYTIYVKVSRDGYCDWYASATVKINASVVTTLDDVVDSEDGMISLREALSYAANGDTISFSPAISGGTITLNGTSLEITSAITIDASNVGGITVDANGKSRAFYVNGGSAENPVELISLTITGGNANYGGGIYNKGTLTITNTTIYGNTSSSSSSYSRGGGIYNTGTLTITNSTISENTVSSPSSFSSSYAYYSYGGGIYNTGTLTVTKSTISENTASTICFSSPDTSSYGGGIYNTGTLTVTNSTILGNTALSKYSTYSSASGGAVYNSLGTITINNSLISLNTSSSSSSSNGGGIHNNHGTVTVTNSTISKNKNSSSNGSYGGGVYNSGTLTVTNSTISENKSFSSTSSDGGGIYNWGTLALTNCTVTGNSADYGGAFYNYGSSYDSSPVLTLTSCTVAGNSSRNGGGICNSLSATAYLYNTIITQNTVSSSGSDIYRFSGPLYAYNTLSSFTDWTESEDCLVYDPTNPLFNDAVNGDYTLVDNSQAIDKGNNSYVETEVDLAGNKRIANGIVDLGAYEYGSALPAEQLASPTILTGNKGVYVSYGANRHQIQWDAIDNASGYELQYSADGNSWTTVLATDTVTVVTGLTYGQNIKYRVRALGTGSYTDSEWSEGKTFAVCPMDVNGDGDIGGLDRNILAVSWGAEEGDGEYQYCADINADGDIGGLDRNFLGPNWGAEVGDNDLIYPATRATAADAVFSEYASADPLRFSDPGR